MGPVAHSGRTTCLHVLCASAATLAAQPSPETLRAYALIMPNAPRKNSARHSVPMIEREATRHPEATEVHGARFARRCYARSRFAVPARHRAASPPPRMSTTSSAARREAQTIAQTSSPSAMPVIAARPRSRTAGSAASGVGGGDSLDFGRDRPMSGCDFYACKMKGGGQNSLWQGANQFLLTSRFFEAPTKSVA